MTTFAFICFAILRHNCLHDSLHSICNQNQNTPEKVEPYQTNDTAPGIIEQEEMATDPEAVRPAVVQAAELAVEPEVLAAVQVGRVQAAELVAVALPDLAQVGRVQAAVASAVALAVADNHLASAAASSAAVDNHPALAVVDILVADNPEADSLAAFADPHDQLSMPQ